MRSKLHYDSTAFRNRVSQIKLSHKISFEDEIDIRALAEGLRIIEEITLRKIGRLEEKIRKSV